MNLFKIPLFPDLHKARFVRRINRFVIECDLAGKPVTAHLPNPGRLWELLLPERLVFLKRNAEQVERATPYTAVAVERDGTPVLLHTQMTNQVVRFLLENRKLPGMEDVQIIRQEAAFGHSRFDFLLQKGPKQLILEVKSCTLFGRELAMFPDAVTERGRKHLLELAELSKRGYACGVVFMVSSPRARFFLPDYHTDFHFAQTLQTVSKDLLIKAVGIHWQDNLTLSETVRDIPIPWPLLATEGQDRGCYILILHLPEDRTLSIGKLGQLFFPKGYYLYTGSARKLLARRLERHGRRRKTFFWHIDYLRDAATSCLAIPVRTADDLEHELAKAMDKIADWSIPHFGCSDCHCRSHLFGMNQNPIHHESFIQLMQYFRMDRLKLDLPPTL